MPPESRTVDETAVKLDAETKQKRFAQWQGLNAFVNANGGWVVSPLDYKRVRIEILENSGLDKKLAEAGYILERHGVGMRATGCSSAAFSPVSIYELSLA
jgi:hypothetical protein